MARIAGVDLPKQKRGLIGLTYIFGIGRTTSAKILEQLDIDPNTKLTINCRRELERSRRKSP
jgi:small subunit ribosomal protein S13